MRLLRHALLAVALLPLTLTLVGCGGDPYAAVLEDGKAAQAELIGILESVTDTASAEQAATKIEAMGEKMRDITARQDALPEPTAEQAEALAAEAMEDDMTAKVGGEMMRIMQIPDVMEILAPAFASLDPGE